MRYETTHQPLQLTVFSSAVAVSIGKITMSRRELPMLRLVIGSEAHQLCLETAMLERKTIKKKMLIENLQIIYFHQLIIFFLLFLSPGW